MTEAEWATEFEARGNPPADEPEFEVVPVDEAGIDIETPRDPREGQWASEEEFRAHMESLRKKPRVREGVKDTRS